MNITQLPAHLSFLDDLAPVSKQALIEALELVQLPAGKLLFRQGEASSACCLVTAGQLQAVLRHPDGTQNNLSTFNPGDWVGEPALFNNHPHTSTIQAAVDSTAAILSAKALEALADRHPDLANAITNQLLRQYRRTQASIILTNLFGPLRDATLQDLQGQVPWLRLRNGEELFHQGEAGDAMYIVVQGRLGFSVEEANGRPGTRGEVGTGESIGEFALLAAAGTPESLRSATVTAMRATDVLSITRPVFEGLLSQYPQAVLNLTRRIIQRQRLIDQSALLGSSALVVCVLPTRPGLGGASPYSELARQLADALQSQGCVQLFDPARFEEWYGKPGAARTPLDDPASLMINTWLDEQECKNQFVIYDATPGAIEGGCLSAWAQRCVEDADVILLVAESGESPVPGPVETCLGQAQSRARLELALIQPNSIQQPAGTAAWLAAERGGAGRFRAHHHIRLGHAPDLRRMARRISGRPLGLALSGGGARGWAHIGALRALGEAGLEIDWVGGASMGSIIAAAVALDWPVSRLADLAKGFADPKKLLDYTFPYVSLTATRRITTILQEVCAGADIEDTWRPFYCISSNLSRGAEQTHLSGSLWKAIRASMAFPTIFAPLEDEGSILIDGGAANNLPVDRLRELCPNGTVVGINLEPGIPVNKTYSFGSSLSGWQALLARLTPFYKNIQAPTVFDIVAGLVDSNNRYRLNETRGCADLIIDVPVQKYGILDFDKYPEIVEAGYAAAREQIKGFVAPPPRR